MINNEFSLKIYLNTLKQKGYLAYEYNPLHNYQINKDLENDDNIIRANSLVDFDTDLLNFDLKHPVDIEILPSYDGSVNLILNDNKNIPRLINSRFSVREKETYEIVDRVGENDTNIYRSDTFDLDTSLYFKCKVNPIISYNNLISGSLPVGQYCFYITYADSDNNESDFVSEISAIPIFVGSDNTPKSIDGGIKNQNSGKGIKLRINNLDDSYNYIYIYYLRYFADYLLNRVVELKKISRKFSISSSSIYINITGNEDYEDLDPNILNINKFNPKNILTQALCKNMLFFGNITKNTDNYKELSDLALRIVPSLKSENIENIKNDYSIQTGTSYGYYNSYNMINKVGYMDSEYYRFGVVFIYNDGTLSSVYNTIGGILSNEVLIQRKNDTIYIEHNSGELERNYIKCDNDGWITSGFTGSYLNNKGVCRIDYNDYVTDKTIFSILFNIKQDIITELKRLGIRGLFFVRQKRIPNILAQCYLLPLDKSSGLPLIETNNNIFIEKFLTSSDTLNNSLYDERLIQVKKESEENFYYAAICPDFLLNQPYYNQIFNGSDFDILLITVKASSNLKLLSNKRIYLVLDGINTRTSEYKQSVTICSVTENVPTVAIDLLIFRSIAGETEEAYKFEEVTSTIVEDGENKKEKIRGIFSPYLAIKSKTKLETSCLYNIFKSQKSDIKLDIMDRMYSSDAFYAISNRYNFDDLSGTENKNISCYKGDCYINTFTYRLNRNFNDPSLPNNDKIIDLNTWKDNYDESNLEKLLDISRSDVNAVLLGSWITFKVRSPFNYALRSEDHSYVSEEALMGSPRSFYPRKEKMWLGIYKMPDSYLYNDAYRETLGFKCYFTLLDVNYIKNTFTNRILYSDIAILDSYKNNYRSSLSTYFRDYSTEYGAITKLVAFEGYLLVILEHGIGLAVINERVLAGTGDGEPVFINTKNVLPEELTIISDTYGTLWGESVIKSEAGYVYGVDTVAKKIWRVKGLLIEILSDFKVNKFLSENITLSERETQPLIGLKNVKTHYNNNKKDIMFTFYDDVYKEEEKVWNLCYNELVGEFITFYSWVPSYSENIDTLFFSFDRNTSKYLSLLRKCNYNIPENTGILIDKPILSGIDTEISLCYRKVLDNKELLVNLDGTSIIYTDNGVQELNVNNVNFEIIKDLFKNSELFTLSGNIITINSRIEFDEKIKKYKVILLYIHASYTIGNTTYDLGTEPIAITTEEILKGATSDTNDDKTLKQDFYVHGHSGIFDVAENIYPCHWYGEYHPFEFEFVVNDKIGQHKIFENLEIISNKAEPQSFHFEIEGDNYEFSLDKRNMYFRLEATKALYLNLGSNILYNRKFTDVGSENYLKLLYFRAKKDKYLELDSVKKYPISFESLTQQVKSTIFPLYYNRISPYNLIYDIYQQMTGDGVDYLNLSGSEVVWNRDLNQFNIVTHIKNSPIDLVGRLRGNSRYKESRWCVLIPSIVFNLKNEEDWSKSLWWKNNDECKYPVPPLVLNNIPDDINESNITPQHLPNTYSNLGLIKLDNWTFRKEARIRDKWMKVKVRYSGKNLAVIHSLITLYNVSYS